MGSDARHHMAESGQGSVTPSPSRVDSHHHQYQSGATAYFLLHSSRWTVSFRSPGKRNKNHVVETAAGLQVESLLVKFHSLATHNTPTHTGEKDSVRLQT